MPHFPVMCLPYSMENQHESKLCHFCFDVGDRCAHNFSLLPKHCCTFIRAIQHYRVVAFTDLPFTSPNYVFWGISLASGGSKCACGSKGRWSKPPLCVFRHPRLSPKSKPLCCDLMPWYISLQSSLTFFFSLFINLCRTELNKQKHSFS